MDEPNEFCSGLHSVLEVCSQQKIQQIKFTSEGVGRDGAIRIVKIKFVLADNNIIILEPDTGDTAWFEIGDNSVYRLSRVARSSDPLIDISMTRDDDRKVDKPEISGTRYPLSDDENQEEYKLTKAKFFLKFKTYGTTQHVPITLCYEHGKEMKPYLFVDMKKSKVFEFL